MYAQSNVVYNQLIDDKLFQAKKDSEEEPYFFDDTPVCPCVGIGQYLPIHVKES